ncbi:MAG: lysophospholipid acyltransferase family protein [Candidatus Omnitrophica bacterium]|nr:lysophospholipid acyltransferase family protein [Candidatus Omnitrophota bacterium]
MFNFILYRIAQFVALALPLKFAYAIAVFSSDLHYLFADKDRKAVNENLKTIFPEKNDKEIKKIQIHMFRNFAKYLVDFFRFSRINTDYIKKNIRVENIHYFDEAIAKKKGVIVLTAHLGNWELGGVVIALSGYPLGVVALPHKDKLVNNFFNNQRESKGIKVIPLGKAVRSCLNLLSQNKLIALVGDRDFTERGVVMDFFNKKAIFPEGPAAFCLKTGADILPGFMIRNPDDTFTLKIDKPIDFTPTGNKEKDTKDIISIYLKIFEGYIRKYPDQWYMFRRFWIS